MDMGFPENNSKVSVPPSYGDNYFSQQAIRAGMITSELRRPELMMNPDPSREMILMELVKERIREKIIASEIIRRLEIEAQVKRKQALERELALGSGDGFSLYPPVFSSALWSEPSRSESKLSIQTFPARTERGPNERFPFQ